jgi:S1-C subfamily serine protease
MARHTAMRPLCLILLSANIVVAQSPQATRKDIPTIAKAANGAIVSIIMSDKDGHALAQGSGFLISKDGLILTNYHVIENGSSAIVKLPDGAFFAVDGVFASDKARDVAIIKAHGKNFLTLTLGNSDQLQVGEEVVAIGNPLSLESTVSNGIVSGIRAVKAEGGTFLQITAPISPGSSGGPLFNMEGKVVGITTLYLKGGENLNFAIPINDAKRLLVENSSTLQDFPDEAPPVKAQTHDEDAPTQQAKPQEPNEGLTPPEVVRSEEVQIDGRIKRITVSNPNNRYHLMCNAETDSCRTPVPDKDYLVFSEATRWRMPGAKEPLTLKFLQDFSVSYQGQQNIALVPSDPDDFNSFGIYVLLSAVQAIPQSARDYFSELKATNAFKSYRDEYACFDDGSSEPSFAVVAKASDVVRMMKKAGATANAHKLEQSEFKDSLFVQMYYKGVGSGEQIYDARGTEGTDFVIVFSSPIKGKMTYSINWATGRYRRAVYALDHSETLPALEFSGKCELIHPDVPVPRR